MSYVLHHCHGARSARTLWLLEELGAEYELVVHPFPPVLLDKPYLDRVAHGRVPALEIDGEVLFESGAIAEVLCERHPGPLWRAPGSAERAQWLQWLHFAETIGAHLASLTQQHVVIFEDKDRSPLVMKLERKRLEKCLGLVEARLAGRDHLLDGGFSAADIAIGYALEVAARFTPLQEVPKAAAYLERLKQRPAYQRAQPPEGTPPLYGRAFYPLPQS